MPLVKNHAVRYGFSLLSDYDLHLFNEGNHNRLYEKLGAHTATVDGQRGTYFAVWAPDAYSVSVIGEFNAWNKASHPLRVPGGSGIWEGFIPELGPGTVYKYHVASRYQGYSMDKADPYAFENEVPPRTASIVWDLGYDWGDEGWMHSRQHHNRLSHPSRSMKCTWAHGCASGKTAIVGSPIANSRPSWPSTPTAWALRTWNSCP